MGGYGGPLRLGAKVGNHSPAGARPGLAQPVTGAEAADFLAVALSG
jgi:hypothetical protein